MRQLRTLTAMSASLLLVSCGQPEGQQEGHRHTDKQMAAMCTASGFTIRQCYYLRNDAVMQDYTKWPSDRDRDDR